MIDKTYDVGYYNIKDDVVDKLRLAFLDYNFINIKHTPRRIYDVVLYSKSLKVEEEQFYEMMGIPIIIGSTFNDVELKLFMLPNEMKPVTSKMAKYRKIVDLHMFINEKIEMLESEQTGHSLRVAMYAKMLASKLGLSTSSQLDIYVAGLMHDIGKIYIPEYILSKRGKLTPLEYEEAKMHSEYGYELLKQDLQPNVADMIRYHHFRENTSKENTDNIGAKIIAVCDSYDSLVTNRVYRKTLTKDEALKEILMESIPLKYGGKGIKYDPYITKVFVDTIK